MAPPAAFMNGSPMYPSSDGDILLKSHEKRLQNLEAAVQDNSKETAACTAKVDALSQQVTEGNAHLVEKLDAGLVRVFERLDAHREQLVTLQAEFKTLGATVTVHDGDLGQLRTTERQRTNRALKMKKSGGALILAALGAIAAKIGDMVWIAFTGRH